MTTEKRQRLLLAGLLAVAALAVVLEGPSWLPVATEPAAEVGPAAAGATPGGRPGKPASPAVRDVIEVQIDALLHPQSEESNLERNPFLFGAPPPPPPPPPPRPLTKEELAERERQQQAAQEAARLAAIEAAKPKPPPLDLLYLGSFGPESRRVAVLADRGKENLWSVVVGQTVAGKFVVAEIGYESVSLGFVGFPDVPPQRLAVGK